MKLLALVFAMIVSLALAIPNVLLHSQTTSFQAVSPERDQLVLAQLAFVREAIEHGAARQMQALYPEGFFFLHTLYGVAWAELALPSQDSSLRHQALREATRSLDSIESSKGTRVFHTDIQPTYGIAYLGWTNYLRGRVLQLQGVGQRDSALFARYRRDLDELAALYDTCASPFQQSYRGMAWSGDNVVPIFALRLHDQVMDTARYAKTIARWVGLAKAEADHLGMMDFEFSYPSGATVKAPRGSGQTLMLRFLGEVDPGFAKAQYDRLRQEFYTTRFGLHLVREFPASDPGEADYDSGPVIWDIGSSATIVSLGTARAFGDTAFAEALERSINFYGVPYNSRGKRVYALGLMPVADAFLAWSRVALPNPKLVESRPEIVHSFDSGWIHLLSLLLAAAAWMPWFVLGARRQGDRLLPTRPASERQQMAVMFCPTSNLFLKDYR
ncbi:MAG: hypothetical protein IPK50_08725 [Fibrobacterota bacterium]|nr:MAG: hypothetical protein IPK50_08725 [Fibrobacterota bacterium]